MRYRSVLNAAIAAIAVLTIAGVMPRDAAAQAPGQPGAANMPFSNIVRRPSLSPYTALGFQGNNPQTGSTLGALQGMVRPQQQQLRQMQQGVRQSRQIDQIRNQMRQGQRTAPQGIDTSIRATGHASTYMNMSHFYPQLMGR